MVGSAACVAKIELKAVLVDASVKKAVDEVCNEIFLFSTKICVPILSGTLKSSAKDVIKETSTSYIHDISYNTRYAWYVHEMYLQHPHNKVRKYLEDPVNMYRAKLMVEIKDAFMEVI